MTSRISAVFVSCLILTTGSACCTTEVEPAVKCPPRPELMPLTEAQIMQADPDTLWVVGSNQLELKAHIKALEARFCPKP